GAELFLNSAIGSSQPTTIATNYAHSGHTATAISGSGTSTTICPTTGATCVMIAGGNGVGTSWEVYDGNLGTFPTARTAGTTTFDLLVPTLSRHVAALFGDGKLLLAGGQNSTPTAQSVTE